MPNHFLAICFILANFAEGVRTTLKQLITSHDASSFLPSSHPSQISPLPYAFVRWIPPPIVHFPPLVSHPPSDQIPLTPSFKEANSEDGTLQAIEKESLNLLRVLQRDKTTFKLDDAFELYEDQTPSAQDEEKVAQKLYLRHKYKQSLELDEEEQVWSPNKKLKVENRFDANEDVNKDAKLKKPSKYFLDRALTLMKSNDYGGAIADATTAIELDRTFLEAYYRRAVAYFALGKLDESRRDLEEVLRIDPTNRDGRLKLSQVQRTLEASHRPRLIRCKLPSQCNNRLLENAALIPANCGVEDSYVGPRLGPDTVVTTSFITEMLELFRSQKMLHRKYILEILWQAHAILSDESTVVDVEVPEGTHITVCGDLHGQYYDLLNVFNLNGMPSDSNPYLFNGDFVDRGSFSVEVIMTLLAFKVRFPRSVHLNRGNHESSEMNRFYGFEREVKQKVGADVMPLFADLFQWLPLAHVIGGGVLVVHGGLFSGDSITLDDVRRMERHREPPPTGPMRDILWSDPQDSPGRSPSKRGAPCVGFGPDVTKKFLERNGLSLLVRSHEFKDDGYEVQHDGKTITVFSAPNYCDALGNRGAYIRFEDDLKPKIIPFEAVPHPYDMPKTYAGGSGLSTSDSLANASMSFSFD